MDKQDIGFDWADAWILLSIIYASKDRGASVKDIISVGDYINHAIMSFEELQSGLGKLIHAGYVLEENGLFNPTEITLAYYKSITKPRRQIRKELSDIEKFLDAVKWQHCYNPTKKDMHYKYTDLTHDMFKKAYEKYTINMTRK